MPNAIPAAVPGFIDFNPVWDQVTLSQGTDVQPGTAYAANWGSLAWAGAAGGQPSYGYRHLHLFNTLSTDAKNKAIRAILSLACCRHMAYVGPDAVIRKDGYEFGCRPFGTQLNKIPYIPLLPNDGTNGGTVWPDPVNPGSFIEWHNHDGQHAWNLLIDVIKTHGVTVPFLTGVPGYETMEANRIAFGRLRAETAAVVGIVTNKDYLDLVIQQGPGNWSDRCSARMLQFPIDSWKVGALDLNLFDAFLAFVKSMRTLYLTPPGCVQITKTIGAGAPYVVGDPYFKLTTCRRSEPPVTTWRTH